MAGQIERDKERARLRKYLRLLTQVVGDYLRSLDAGMRNPHSKERDQWLSKLANALEMTNDEARYFGLHIDYRTDRKQDGDRALVLATKLEEAAAAIRAAEKEK